jgi:glutamyl-Q tRNA(Asp) synthetase
LAAKKPSSAPCCIAWASISAAYTADPGLTGGFVTRFAPSPTGYLHRGHAFSALNAARAAREADGRFLLRIEDIDTARCKPEFEAAIADDLAWLGLEWETPVRRQSQHLAVYRNALARLESAGLLYPCARTRRDILEGIGRAPQDGDPRDERMETADGPVAWRLSLQAAQRKLGAVQDLTFVEEGEGPTGETGVITVDPHRIGDVILGRKDLGVSYHLAVVIDDAIQGVSHVIRGNDLFAASHVQRVLQALLDLPTPVYRHHRLELRPDGKRFAKRDTTETLRDLRKRGVTTEALRAFLGF